MKTPFVSQFSPLILTAFVMTSLAHASETGVKAGGNTVALWNFGEGSSLSVIDQDVSGTELQPQSEENGETVTEVETEFGKALFFPGTASLVSTTGNPIATPDQVTLEVWLKLDPEGNSTDRGVFQHSMHGQSGFRMQVDQRGHVIWMAQDGTQEVALTSMMALPEDEWVHVAGTFDGSTMGIYVNGQLDSELPVEGINPQGDGPVYVGVVSAGPPPYFRGAIRAIRISDTALTSFEIE